MNDKQSADAAVAGYRYGMVFLLIFAVVVFIIVTPDGAASQAVAFAIIAAALAVVIGTSRERSSVRRRRVLVAGALATLITVGIAVGLVSRNASFVLIAVMTLAIPITLARGLLRLIRDQGVTTQAVAGALAIYLLLGLTFASAIGFVAAVGPHYYFAQGTNGSASSNLYYSFTVMTTTGFGDFTAAYRVGRALAVIEMLIGQLYLVTVIGILIGRRVESAR
jgi:Ion channel